MHIHTIRGDVCEIAPTRAEAAILWLRSGFNRRQQIWLKLLEKYLGRMVPVLSVPMNPRAAVQTDTFVNLGRLWADRADQLLELQPAVQRLRYLYILANPDDGKGYQTTTRLTGFLRRSLTILADRQVRDVAMIHIPLAVPRNEVRRPYDQQSAAAMMEAITVWDLRKPGQIDNVYLVDLKGAFASLVEQRRPISE